MLYDPTWEQKTKADPPSLAGLIAWLERQDPTVAYDYCDPGTCLAAQYLKSQGVEAFMLTPGELDELIPGLNSIVQDTNEIVQDCTFGAALKRAKAVAVYGTCVGIAPDGKTKTGDQDGQRA
jgi:hypothetical protein